MPTRLRRCWSSTLHLARGAFNGGATFHNQGGPYGHTNGAKRVVAVDVTGLPVGALVVPASTHENRASELMLDHLTRQASSTGSNWSWWTAGSPSRRLADSADVTRSKCGAGGLGRQAAVFLPIRHAWRVEVAHGRLGRSRRLAKSFENTTTSATGWLLVACIATTHATLSRAHLDSPALATAA